ncbi:hypothetical protein RB653_003015 [Dictyostelium firmibasis]|uniref:Uncharacterized protein n=1 Tax=Dictyostelium firmibasis TaxID=79012 RepID=A0AAN7TYV3_9MYCE
MDNNKDITFKKFKFLLNIIQKRKKLALFLFLSILSIFLKRKLLLKTICQLSFLPNFIKLFIQQKLLSSTNSNNSNVSPTTTTTPNSNNSNEDILNNNNIFSFRYNSNNGEDSSDESNNNKKKQPKKVTLNQLQRKKVCVSTIGTIFKKNVYYEHIADRRVCEFKFMESERNILLKLAKETDLYLITQTEDLQEEDQVARLLKQYGIIDAGLNPHKSLYCSTSQGKGHMSRHLETVLHIDGSDIEVLTMLKPFVKNLVFINSNSNLKTTTTTTTTSSSSSSSSSSNGVTVSVSPITPKTNSEQGIYTATSLHEYFDYFN